MKKLLITLGLAAFTLVSAQAQGTIQFNSLPSSRVRDADGQYMTAPFNVAVYFAETAGAWQGPVQPIGRSSPTLPGVFTAPSGINYQIPGTEVVQVIFVQIYAWTAEQGDDPYQAWLAGARTAITEVRQFQLGPTSGPGTVIWSASNPALFSPLQFNLGPAPAPPIVPEPSILALGALGGLLLLFRRCKSARK